MRTFGFAFALLATSLGLALATEGCNTVVFPLKLTWEKHAPDGFRRDMIMMNGQFPGPPLQINEGDDVEFVVNNQLPFPATIHFHGIEQKETPWSDGVPGLSQTPIPSNQTFTYRWKATQYGTYWYHGHYQGGLEDGLFGAIDIQPKNGTLVPFSMISNDTKALGQMRAAAADPKLVVLSDWSHFTSTQLHDVSVAADIDPLCGDSILIDGRGAVNCPGVPFLMTLIPPPVLPLLAGANLTDKGCLPVTNLAGQTANPHNFSAVPSGLFEGCKASSGGTAKIRVDPRHGWVSLNFISTASLQETVLSIDDHPLWVYAVDGRYVVPQKIDAITFPHGSRYSVFVQLDQPARDYTLRVAGDGLNQKIFNSAIFHYENQHGNDTNIPHPSIDYAGVNTTAVVTFLDAMSVVPFPPATPAKTVDQTVKLSLNRTGGTAWQWTLNNNTPFPETLEHIEPLLWNPNQLQNTGLTFFTKNNTWVDIIIIASITAGQQPPHPIHKHSNKAHIIGSGIGEFNYTDVAEAMKYIPASFNLDNPPYRDGFYTLPVSTNSTWMAVRYHVVNPGAFLLHCHINPHLTGGMAVTILDGLDAWPTVPKEYGPGGNGKR